MSRYDFYFEPTRPRAVEGGLKARSQRGEFVKNWWATAWIRALERLVDSGRLGRGRSYARRGQVLKIEEKKGRIEARVQGSRATPYKISIALKPLSESEWDKVIDALAGQALFTAQLLAGDMPQEIESAFDAAGVSLFPTSRQDLETSCSCPDAANPCKHVAAVHYILGERFDEDPFLLFRLRGRTQEQLLAALRQRRSGALDLDEEADAAPESTAPLETAPNRFWELAAPLDLFPLFIQAPTIAQPLLKRLGEAPFVSGPALDEQLAPAYQAMTEAALALAFAEATALGQDE